jgi:PST family polysaccharide transporter
MFFIGLGLFIFSKEIIIFIFGKEFLISAIVLKIMAFIPMIHTFLHIYAIPNMIIFDFKKVYSKIVFSGFIISILSSFLFIKFYDISGAAYSSLVTELFLLVLFSRYLQKNLKIKVTKI